MSDKTFSPPSEELRTKLLARSGQCERLVRESDRRAITGVSPSRFERFFALWPDRIRSYLNSLSDLDGLSQFPTLPSENSEVTENE